MGKGMFGLEMSQSMRDGTYLHKCGGLSQLLDITNCVTIALTKQ